MICPHCDKEFFSKQIRTCPHCGKSLEGYTGTTEELNELERRKAFITGANGDGSSWLKLFELVLAIVIGLVIIGAFVLTYIYASALGNW
tara:strand:+ start:94 stop:360 length:267 start_codon:yes stop_codon:yes gene_type:complete